MRLQISSWPTGGGDAPCLSLLCCHPFTPQVGGHILQTLTAGRASETSLRVHNYYFTGKGLSRTPEAVSHREAAQTPVPCGQPSVQLPSLDK